MTTLETKAPSTNWRRDLIVDGRRLALLDTGEHDRTCVLVHGLAASWDYWRLTIPALTASHRVVAVDLPGFGYSEDRGRYGPDELVKVLIELVNQERIDTVDLIGHSMGTVVVSEFAARYPDRVGVRLGFEEGTARRMYAGSDFLLMPSRFEPCGLSQMYAQKFGSLPIAHRTGGLADTIEDGVTGFLFREPSLGELLGAVYRAVDAFRSRKKLNTMRRAAMGRHYPWQRSALGYKRVYDRALTGALARS